MLDFPENSPTVTLVPAAPTKEALLIAALTQKCDGSEIDQQILGLYQDLVQHPTESLQRKQLATAIFDLVYKSGTLARVKLNSPDELAVVAYTLLRFVEKAGDFDPDYRKEKTPAHWQTNGSILQGLSYWLGGIMSFELRRIRHSSYGQDAHCVSLDRMVKPDADSNTFLDLLTEDRTFANQPTKLSEAFGRFAEQREAKQTYGYIGEAIAQDKTGKLQGTYPQGRPDCNAQVVLHSYWQEEQFQTLVDRLNVGYDDDNPLKVDYYALYSFRKRRCFTLLAEIALDCDYEPETLKSAAIEDAKQILEKCHIKGCGECNANRLALWLYPSQEEIGWTFTRISIELNTRWHYSLSASQIEDFWHQKGMPALAKVIRLQAQKSKKSKKSTSNN
jgi:hypothetical protein